MKITEAIVKRRVFFGFVFAVVFLALATPDWITIAIGFPLGIPGLGIRAWSSGLIRKNKELAQDGPYSVVRNPLYLGSFIAGCGVAIMGGNVWLALAFVGTYLLTYRRIILNEEEYLLKIFPDQLPGYMVKVPRFFPAIGQFSGFGQYDATLMLKKHKEWNAWLGYLAVSAVLISKITWPELFLISRF